MSTRQAIDFASLTGICLENASILRAQHYQDSVRILDLSHLGRDGTIFLYGDELTWDVIDNLAISLGDNLNLTYDAPEPGWRYEWNLGRKRFTVSDNLGNVTVYDDVEHYEDLMISWDVAESHAFVIVIDASYAPDPFPIGTKSRERGAKAQGYAWGENDRYLLGEDHFLFEQIIGVSRQLGDGSATIFNPDLISHESVREPLFAKTHPLQQSGDYLTNIMFTSLVDAIICGRPLPKRYGQEIPLGLLLLIQQFASLTSVSYPNSWPWMLYKLWQWQWEYTKPPGPRPGDDDFSGPSKDRIYDKVFDLSPNWG